MASFILQWNLTNNERIFYRNFFLLTGVRLKRGLRIVWKCVLCSKRMYYIDLKLLCCFFQGLKLYSICPAVAFKNKCCPKKFIYLCSNFSASIVRRLKTVFFGLS